VHSEPVSMHFVIYLGLGVYGHGTCLHSLQGTRDPRLRLLWPDDRDATDGSGIAGAAAAVAAMVSRT
jgi:hypothetical protein